MQKMYNGQYATAIRTAMWPTTRFKSQKLQLLRVTLFYFIFLLFFKIELIRSHALLKKRLFFLVVCEEKTL